MTTTYLTTTIPYVNAAPHLGFALEAVQADVLARHHRRRGDDVRLLTGTDDNSLKNVLAAEAAGLDVQAFVDAQRRRVRRAARAARPVVRRLHPHQHRSPAPARGRGAVAGLRGHGDLYRGPVRGAVLRGLRALPHRGRTDADGHCPEHHEPPQRLAEENWFFRLSRYADRCATPSTSGVLRIEPAARRNEVLAFIAGGLRDFSVSRSRHRARGWGIPVPDDPDQVIYVWWDALGNYVTGLDYSRTAPNSGAGGPAPTGASTWSARACCGSTPCTGRRCCSRPGCRCRPTSSCTTT